MPGQHNLQRCTSSKPALRAFESFLLWVVVIAALVDETCSFSLRTSTISSRSPSLLSPYCKSRKALVLLEAKKKKGKASSGKGFGKAPVDVDKPLSIEEASSDIDVRAGQQRDQEFLTSVPGGSDAIPTMSSVELDESVPVEERTNSILREKYGLRTREEQQAEYERQQKAAEQRRKLEQWKEQADRGEDFDLIQILPGPVLIFIDRFLKAGVAVCTVLFVAAGLAITVEAGSKATGNALPENVDAFITNVVEPNFTPGLLVLLGFSVSLGAFAALQLSSASSTYREDR